MFQASPLLLSRPRDNDARTRWNFEDATLENAFNRTREKRSVQRASESDVHTNNRDVRISHRYQYFLQVTNDGQVSGTKDSSSGNSKSSNLNLFLFYKMMGLVVYEFIKLNGLFLAKNVIIRGQTWQDATHTKALGYLRAFDIFLSVFKSSGAYVCVCFFITENV